jgi:hypothetical protein
MRRIKTIVVTAALALAIVAGWRVGSDEVANLQLQDDLQDLVSPNYIRYAPPRSDDDLRAAVIRKAKELGIQLTPDQVTVRHRDPGVTPALYLAADYRVPVNLPGFSFTMHFTPSSTKDAF